MDYLALPVVNFATLGQANTLRALDSACRNWGAFQLVGHPFSQPLQARLAESMTSFFHQPRAVKKQVERSESNPWGFFDHELTRQSPDWKEVYDYGPADGMTIEPQWPTQVADFEDTVTAYYQACEQISFELMAAIAANLGTPAEQIQNCFRPQHTSFVRLNYYPLCEQPASPRGDEAAIEGFLGVNPHTDAGAITLLMQDQQAGLEIYRQQRWHKVAGGSLVVNLGDILQVWSNDRYHAPLHRVRANCEAERFTAPFFFNPSYDTQYRPLPSTVDQKNPARYKAIEWGEFRRQRATGDYANHGQEIQISQFQI
jgi:isopenicillin N synthase-like dioxygenase